MKILVISNSSSGLYDFRKELLQELSANNELLLAVPEDGRAAQLGELLQCGIRITDIDRRGINPIRDLMLLRHYVHMLRDFKPDVVLTYTIKPNIYGGCACRLCKTPYIANITGLGTVFEKKRILAIYYSDVISNGIKKSELCFFFRIVKTRNYLSL